MGVEVFLRLVRQLPIRELDRVVTILTNLGGYRFCNVLWVLL